MLRGLKVYSRIVYWFANKEVTPNLYDAFSTYRLHLISLLGTLYLRIRPGLPSHIRSYPTLTQTR